MTKLPAYIIIALTVLAVTVVGSMVYLLVAGDENDADIFVKNIILLANTVVSVWAAVQARKAMTASNETKTVVQTQEIRRSEGMD